MFVFIIFLLSFLIFFSSIYFWSQIIIYQLTLKDTILDAPVVRGKIFENSLYSLNKFKKFIYWKWMGK